MSYCAQKQVILCNTCDNPRLADSWRKYENLLRRISWARSSKRQGNSTSDRLRKNLSGMRSIFCSWRLFIQSCYTSRWREFQQPARVVREVRFRNPGVRRRRHISTTSEREVLNKQWLSLRRSRSEARMDQTTTRLVSGNIYVLYSRHIEKRFFKWLKAKPRPRA